MWTTTKTLWDFDSFTFPSRALPSLHAFPWPSANTTLFSCIGKIKADPTIQATESVDGPDEDSIFMGEDFGLRRDR